MNARRGLLAIALLVPLACTTSGSNYPFPPPPSTGAGGAVMPPPPNGNVIVTITSPADGATVIASSGIAVMATVTDDGTDFIDTSSVTMTLMAMGSTAVVASGQLVSGGGDTYAGMISLGTLPSGPYTLTVSARSSTGITGQNSVTLMIQGGPTLIVNSPAENQSYSDSLTIEVMVAVGAPAPTAVLAGMPIVWAAGYPMTSGMYDIYRQTVWFGPPPAPAGSQAFPPLSGAQLLDVTETDGGATTEVLRTFKIDTTGPTITLTTPGPGLVVGGVVNISATITDDSGVLDSSVVAVIGDDQGNPVFTLTLPPQGSNVYSLLFDTLNLTQCAPPPATSLCIVFPTISFRATDAVGNETSLGYDFSVDNIPPLSDLDPPMLRQMRLTPTGYECSFLFDPLSVNRDLGDMPNDLCMVPQVFDLRARIEDQGNRANGLKVTPIAGIDPGNTSVYILADTADPNQPLVVDSDGDGYCDMINPLLAPTVGPLTQADQVLKIRLAGVKQGGNADFRADATLPANAPCAEGTDLAPPKVLCSFEQPTIAISYANGQPDIWSVEPIDDFRCLGNQLDTKANNIPDGQWICIAVGSTDLAGNHGVSTPMRVYVKYDDAGGFCAAPPSNAGAPPTCTGTYDPANKAAAAGNGCKTLGFTGTEYYCAPGGC